MFSIISRKTVPFFGTRLALLVLSVVLPAILVGTCLPAVHAQTVPADHFGTEGEPETDAFTVTLAKEPLGEEFCTAVDTYIECAVDGVDLPADGKAANAMAGFYETTGVQPYLVITDTIKIDAKPEWEDDPAYYYLQDKYLRLFGMDEGHYLLVMLLKETGGFDVMSRAGNDAYAVMDDDAIQKTEDLFRSTCDLNDLDNTLTQVFMQAATDVMQYTNDEPYVTYEDGNGGYFTADGEFIYDPERFLNDYSADDDVSYYMFGFLLFPLAIFVRILVKKAKEEKTASSRRRASSKTSSYNNGGNGYHPNVAQAPPKEAAPKRANYPITCPGCGATAYPNDDGTCQYCGRAIFDPRA